MRILWLTNVITKQAADALHCTPSHSGGWLSGAANALQDCVDIQLGICFPQRISPELITKTSAGVTYYGYPATDNISRRSRKTDACMQQVLNAFQPDIVHVWGTEFSHSLSMVEAFNRPEHTIVSIQGLCSVISQHYYAHMPNGIEKNITLRDFLKQDRICDQKKKFIKRASVEKAVLKKAGHIIGRTQMDYAVSSQISPEANYHKCNETLRDSFYENAGSWHPEKCQKHSIFVSQSYYPLKGFHIMLQALQEILRHYPDAVLYTTGPSPFRQSFYRINSYQKYLKKLIRRYSMEKHVVFLNRLNEEKMCQQFLDSNVFVSPSSIENSPNSVAEAMLLGVPVVASYVGGTMDLLKDKEEGYLYQADASYMLAHYVCTVFADTETAAEMAKKATAHAKITHDPLTNLQQLLQIYTEVLHGDGSL